ncbi:hypothetical protein [Polyangium sp. 15x6]|uniref:Kelch repeat-containing protein n=1 Tax=Polyangium sp. 15x6 TaxID=3042687 RepID=UPI00249C4136|nr:hypothetical protein [Polyangium sp. 15x6]MDI3289218.1 hypothetical protein [Polyangium sp. 15x6]
MLSRTFFLALLPLACFACSDPDSNEPPPYQGGPPKEIVWSALPTDGAPAPRYAHSAVWTGSKMIVWGGDLGGNPAATNTGGIYDPATRTWKSTSTAGAPAARFSHTALWTGSKMIVWGGFGATDLEAAGGIYDPEADTWAPMSTMGQPPPRFAHTAVWTGSKMIVWGGASGANVLNSGGIYDPATDTWTSTNGAGSPPARRYHGAAWNGKQMLVWGGTDAFDWRNDGMMFDPMGTPQGVWIQSTSTSGAPEGRERMTVIATGPSFLVWGGWNGGVNLNTGGQLDAASIEWTPMTINGAPGARADHVSVWAGNHLVVWGGCRETPCMPGNIEGDGGQYVPSKSGGTWYPITAQASLSPRYGTTLVYTKSSVIVWGGRTDPSTRTNTGAEAPL